MSTSQNIITSKSKTGLEHLTIRGRKVASIRSVNGEWQGTTPRSGLVAISAQLPICRRRTISAVRKEKSA